MNHVFLILMGVSAALIGFLVVQWLFKLGGDPKTRLQARLATQHDKETAAGSYRPIILPKQQAKNEGALFQSEILKRLARKIGHAYPKLTVMGFLSVAGVLALTVFGIGALLTRSAFVGALAGLLAAMVPFALLTARCTRRGKIIDDQLPDALDFLARILRAGHSLPTAFQMAGEELPDPLASEFQRCYDQHSLGTPLEGVLRDAAIRVDEPDFAFFVTAVLIQRQTGGDLAEVLKNIGGMVRSRVRLQQHVKAITAEGRLVGYILLALPIVFFFILYAINPQYAGVLLNTVEGRWLLVIGAIMQVLGLLTIKKIVAVKM
ncbi:MAG: type II secretion system F family protein [Tepidisphaeraceae bacterium]